MKTSDLPERKNDATKDGHPSVNNPLSKKLNKILESRVDNDKVEFGALLGSIAYLINVKLGFVRDNLIT